MESAASRSGRSAAPSRSARDVGAESLREPLVVEPRLLAVGHAGQRDGSGGDDREQRGETHPGPDRQALQPQEGHGAGREHAADQQRPRGAERHHRRDGEGDEPAERDELVAAPRAPRPEREQAGEHAQQRTEQLQRAAGPRIRADVREPHAPERVGALGDPGGELVPARRFEQHERDAGGGERADERDARDHERGRLAPPREPPGRRERRARRHGDGDPQEHAPGADAGHHPPPLQPAHERERGQTDEPRRRGRHQRRGRAAGRRGAEPVRFVAGGRGTRAHRCARGTGRQRGAAIGVWVDGHRTADDRTAPGRPADESGPVYAFSNSCWRSSIRRIFPVSVLGRVSTNSIRRG